MNELALPIVLATLTAGTPLMYAAIGELVAEKSGVLNLGVEGMMLVGALAAIATAVSTDNIALGALAGAGAGCALALVFAIATLGLQANQVATGLALSILGGGLSAFAGKAYTATTIEGLKPSIGIGALTLDPLVVLSIIIVALVAWFLYRTRAGLVLRAVGESPRTAHEVGHPVSAIRYAATLFGGAMAGLGGAYLSLAYTPMWVEGMTAGRGWIALALVVFATWRPWRALIGAYLFGGVTLAQFQAQALGIALPGELLAALPYIATIVVLVMISRNRALIRLNAPAALGQPFRAGD